MSIELALLGAPQARLCFSSLVIRFLAIFPSPSLPFSSLSPSSPSLSLLSLSFPSFSLLSPSPPSFPLSLSLPLLLLSLPSSLKSKGEKERRERERKKEEGKRGAGGGRGEGKLNQRSSLSFSLLLHFWSLGLGFLLFELRPEGRLTGEEREEGRGQSYQT